MSNIYITTKERINNKYKYVTVPKIKNLDSRVRTNATILIFNINVEFLYVLSIIRNNLLVHKYPDLNYDLVNMYCIDKYICVLLKYNSNVKINPINMFHKDIYDLFSSILLCGNYENMTYSGILRIISSNMENVCTVKRILTQISAGNNSIIKFSMSKDSFRYSNHITSLYCGIAENYYEIYGLKYMTGYTYSSIVTCYLSECRYSYMIDNLYSLRRNSRRSIVIRREVLDRKINYKATTYGNKDILYYKGSKYLVKITKCAGDLIKLPKQEIYSPTHNIDGYIEFNNTDVISLTMFVESAQIGECLHKNVTNLLNSKYLGKHCICYVYVISNYSWDGNITCVAKLLDIIQINLPTYTKHITYLKVLNVGKLYNVNFFIERGGAKYMLSTRIFSIFSKYTKLTYIELMLSIGVPINILTTNIFDKTLELFDNLYIKYSFMAEMFGTMYQKLLSADKNNTKWFLEDTLTFYTNLCSIDDIVNVSQKLEEQFNNSISLIEQLKQHYSTICCSSFDTYNVYERPLYIFDLILINLYGFSYNNVNYGLNYRLNRVDLAALQSTDILISRTIASIYTILKWVQSYMDYMKSTDIDIYSPTLIDSTQSLLGIIKDYYLFLYRNTRYTSICISNIDSKNLEYGCRHLNNIHDIYTRAKNRQDLKAPVIYNVEEYISISEIYELIINNINTVHPVVIIFKYNNIKKPYRLSTLYCADAADISSWYRVLQSIILYVFNKLQNFIKSGDLDQINVDDPTEVLEMSSL